LSGRFPVRDNSLEVLHQVVECSRALGIQQACKVTGEYQFDQRRIGNGDLLPDGCNVFQSFVTAPGAGRFSHRSGKQAHCRSIDLVQQVFLALEMAVNGSFSNTCS
jgi:hypothetical protein